MTCPVCGERTLIYDSRPDESGESVRRRRKCRVCGHRFTTIEVDADSLRDKGGARHVGNETVR
jgi:transcriptional regulator NrdR family protein